MIITKADLKWWEEQGKLCRESMAHYAKSSPKAAGQCIQLIKYYGQINEKR